MSLWSEVPNQWAKWFSIILVAPWLGHGRATECMLALMALSYGMALLIFPHLGFESQALRDMFWAGNGVYVALALMLKSLFTGWGLLANILNWHWDRTLRFVGAFVGAAIWLWFICQFSFNSAMGSVGTFAAFWFFVFSTRTMGMCVLGLPHPGTPGRQ